MIIKIENKIYLLDINSVGKKILNSNKVKIISLFIFITLTSIDVLNFLNLGHQNKIMSENKKAIVVLTGGSKRLEEGFQLLQKKIGNALFISGVNPIVTKKDLRIILNNNNSEDKNILFNCCVYYEKKSRNTQTNSIEANKWLIKNKYNEIILVTSSYHMPRSVYEFKKNAPDIMIYPWNIFHKEKTILDNIEKLTLEYLKYNLIRLQYLFKKNYSYEN